MASLRASHVTVRYSFPLASLDNLANENSREILTSSEGNGVECIPPIGMSRVL